MRKIKTSQDKIDKMRGGITDILASCPKCTSIKVKYATGNIGWRTTAVLFPKVPKIVCPKCKDKKNSI